MSLIAAILTLIALVRWLDIPSTTLIVVSPLVFVLAGVLGMAQGVA